MKKHVLVWIASSIFLWTTFFVLTNRPELEFELAQPSTLENLTPAIAVILTSEILGLFVTFGLPVLYWYNRSLDRLANATAPFIPWG